MSDLLKNIDRRTRMAGANRMELLLFTLHDQQRFGINVFKVREVIRTPDISIVPKADPRIVGIADIRGTTMPMIDLGLALNMPPMTPINKTLTIVAEFNSSVQGFLVGSVDRIVHLRWEDILPPPEALAGVNYLTGVTKVNGALVEIVDVERVLQEVSGNITTDLPEEVVQSGIKAANGRVFHVVGCDDSAVARSKMKEVFDKIGVQYTIVNNGRLALDLLKSMADQADNGTMPPIDKRVLMVVSDIEMPEMDGYTLTANIRKDPRLKNLYVVLNSSLSGDFNLSMTEKVGANLFLSKWHTNELAKLAIQRMEAWQGV
jgi:two-component system chemotaxis response regulator CheV